MARKKSPVVRQELVNLFRQLALNGDRRANPNVSRRRRRNRRRNGGAVNTNSSSVPMVPRAPQLTTPGTGGLRIRYNEYWTTLKSGTKEVDTLIFGIGLSAVEMPTHLSSLAKAYDRYSLHKISIHYKPSVGTTVDGFVYASVDWDASDDSPSLSRVRGMWPQLRLPVWQSGDMTLPASRLQDKKVLYVAKSKPFAIQVALPKVTSASDSKSYGDLYVSYDISFEGASGN